MTKRQSKVVYFKFISSHKSKQMNRFEFTAAALSDGETVIVKHEGVKIYDGHEKVSLSDKTHFLSNRSQRYFGVCENVLKNFQKYSLEFV